MAQTPHEPNRLAAFSWLALAAGIVSMAVLLGYLTVELMRAETQIVRKERLIRAVMHHYGWTPEQIDAIAAGTLDPYAPESRPPEAAP